MKTNTNLILLIVICVGMSIPVLAWSQPVTVNFSDGTYIGSLDSVYIENGFTFFVPEGNHTDLGPLGEASFGITPYLAYGWHNGGGNPEIDNNVTLDFGGAAFDLFSLDIIDDPFGQNQNLPAFTIDLISSVGTVTVSGDTPATINLNWTNITSVIMSVNDAPECVTDGCRHNGVIDNVVVNAVPEPTSLSLVGAAIIALGLVRRPSS